MAVEVTLEVYEFLDRADHKAENMSHEQRRHWDGREFDEYIVATEGVGIYGETPEESFVMVLTVYGRMFSLWMYAAIAPVPLSAFAGEPTSSVGKNFLRSYAGVCLQGVVIALACIIFSALATSAPTVAAGTSAITAVWSYVGSLAFNLLVLVGAVKGGDRIVKEIMGL